MESPTQQFTNEIYNHRGIIHKICRVYRKEASDREDLFQEIIYNAWRSYESFEGKSAFSTWLYRVAINTAMYETRKNKIFSSLSGLDLVEQLPAPSDDKDAKEQLWFAVDRLDPLEKSIVVCYLDELSYKEISQITGLSESNVGVKLNRIKTKIKTIIIEHGIR